MEFLTPPGQGLHLKRRFYLQKAVTALKYFTLIRCYLQGKPGTAHKKTPAQVGRNFEDMFTDVVDYILLFAVERGTSLRGRWRNWTRKGKNFAFISLLDGCGLVIIGLSCYFCLMGRCQGKIKNLQSQVIKRDSFRSEYMNFINSNFRTKRRFYWNSAHLQNISYITTNSLLQYS